MGGGGKVAINGHEKRNIFLIAKMVPPCSTLHPFTSPLGPALIGLQIVVENLTAQRNKARP